MDHLHWLGRAALLLAIFLLVAARVSPLAAQGVPADKSSPAVLRLTLDEIKQRVLADNKLLQLAALNVQSKGYATRAVQANYFPQIVGQSLFVHFNDDLGTVLTAGGRTVTGPLGRPLGTLPTTTVDLPILNQNSAQHDRGRATDHRLAEGSPGRQDRAG